MFYFTCDRSYRLCVESIRAAALFFRQYYCSHCNDWRPVGGYALQVSFSSTVEVSLWEPDTSATRHFDTTKWVPKFKTNHRWSCVSSELFRVEVSRLFLDHGTRVEVSWDRCRSVPEYLDADLSGNRIVSEPSYKSRSVFAPQTCGLLFAPLSVKNVSARYMLVNRGAAQATANVWVEIQAGGRPDRHQNILMQYVLQLSTNEQRFWATGNMKMAYVQAYWFIDVDDAGMSLNFPAYHDASRAVVNV